jgi:hypothetical protein
VGDTADFDDPPLNDPVSDVRSMPSNMERAETRIDFVSGLWIQ